MKAGIGNNMSTPKCKPTVKNNNNVLCPQISVLWTGEVAQSWGTCLSGVRSWVWYSELHHDGD